MFRLGRGVCTLQWNDSCAYSFLKLAFCIELEATNIGLEDTTDMCISCLLLWRRAGMGSEGRRCRTAAQRPWVNAGKISEQLGEQPHQQTGARTSGEALGKPAVFASARRPRSTDKFTAPCTVKEGWLDSPREPSSLSFHKGHGCHCGDLSL